MELVISKIHELLRKDLPKGKVKEYYTKVPDTINDSLLPCVASQVTSMRSRLGMTGHDVVTCTVDVNVFCSKKQGISAQHNKGKSTPYTEMLNLICGLNDNNSAYTTYTDDSIVGVLRKHMTLQGSTANTGSMLSFLNVVDVSIDRPDTESALYQAIVTVEVSLIVRVDNRT